MVKKTLISVFIFLHFVVFVPSVRAEYESIYHYYVEEGVEAFYKNDFENAIFYFKTAYAIDPSRWQPQQYLNLIKREKEGRVNSVTLPVSGDVSGALSGSITKSTGMTQAAPAGLTEKVQQETSSRIEQKNPVGSSVSFVPSVKQPDFSSEGKTSFAQSIKIEALSSPSNLSKTKGKVAPKEEITSTPLPPFKPKGPLAPQVERSYSVTTPSGSVRHFADKEELKLNDELWAKHLEMTLEIEIGKSVIFVGKNITKYLVTVLDMLEVTRIDKDRIRVKALKRGSTIFYVWDDKGRWAFNIRCVYPFESTSSKKNKSLKQVLAEPFHFSYANSWNSAYKGSELKNIKRQYMNFTNWVGIDGETPYGYFDASIDTYMFPASTEIVGQRVGLTDGTIGPFKNFRLRGYDTYAGLSDLTLVGRGFRGILFDSFTPNRRLFYSVFHGQDQSVSIYSNSGSVEKRQSFIEGFKLVLNPDELSGRYTLNFAHGYGAARLNEFEDKVFSIETRQQFKGFNITGELGYDSDEYASLVSAKYEKDAVNFNVNMRDVNPGYSTLYGAPINSGQIGTAFSLLVKPQEFYWDTFLDLYRDRFQTNSDNSNLVNMDFSTSYSRPIDSLSSWGASFGYVNTAQTFSPHQFLQLGTTYSKSIEVGKLRYLSLSLGQNMQWSRYSDSPTSDYDRYGLRAGLRYKLFKYVYASMSYEYSIVHDIFNEEWSSPSAIETGISYNAPLANNLFFNYGLTYRNEYQAKSNFSFLAGQDSVSNSFSLTYHPVSDVSIYFDNQLRRVWPENTQITPAFYDLNMSIGLRSKWELPFRWNPSGLVQGVVYKDYDGNSLQNKDEPGIAGIKVIAGKYETVTNDNGEYSLKVSAKKVTVSLDLKTIPQGFVFSTALSRDIAIEHNKPVRVNFGLSSRSGIYGVAFLDINGSGKPDHGDKFISNIVIRLDSGDITKTDFSGSYFFENVTPGKHKIRIDVTSIPMRYLPTVKVETAIDLEEGMTYVQNIPLKESPAPVKP